MTISTITDSVKNVDRELGGQQLRSAAEEIEARKRKRKLKQLAMLLRDGGMHALNTTLSDARATATARREGEVSGVVMEVVDSSSLDAVPYWRQGDANMLTVEALKARAQIRYHNDVDEELQRWWQCSLTSMKEERRAHGILSKEDYVVLSLKLNKCMVPQFDEAEARAAAEVDWVNDSKGEAHLTRATFMDCVFELADVWTRGLDPAEYVEFLRALFEHLTILNPQGLFEWKHTQDIPYGGYADSDSSSSDASHSADESACCCRSKTSKDAPIARKKAVANAKKLRSREARNLRGPPKGARSREWSDDGAVEGTHWSGRNKPLQRVADGKAHVREHQGQGAKALQTSPAPERRTCGSKPTQAEGELKHQGVPKASGVRDAVAQARAAAGPVEAQPVPPAAGCSVAPCKGWEVESSDPVASTPRIRLPAIAAAAEVAASGKAPGWEVVALVRRLLAEKGVHKKGGPTDGVSPRTVHTMARVATVYGGSEFKPVSAAPPQSPRPPTQPRSASLATQRQPRQRPQASAPPGRTPLVLDPLSQSPPSAPVNTGRCTLSFDKPQAKSMRAKQQNDMAKGMRGKALTGRHGAPSRGISNGGISYGATLF